jgi:pilus assembly protein FimV
VILVLVCYGAWAWRRKKAGQSKFQDSVLGATAGGAAASVFGSTASAAPVASSAGGPAALEPAPAAADAAAPIAEAGADELDPIAEADVYMAYGRNAQAEEILKEALNKDPDRLPVHAKLLEVYANQRDTKALEQATLKIKALTGASGPEWDKAMSLGYSVDPQNPLYASAAGSAAPAEDAGAAASGPSVDFDIGGGDAAAPAAADATGPVDFDLGAGGATEPAKQEPAALDFDLGGATEEKTDFAPGGTLVLDQETKDASGGLDFDLGGDAEKTAVMSAAAAPAKPAADPDATVAMDFDLNLDLGGAKPEPKPEAGALDLGSISLDLGGSSSTQSAPAGGGDARWQEVATKLDLAKAYQDMGDKDGARELLNEVLKDGDAAQQDQARQMLDGLG